MSNRFVAARLAVGAGLAAAALLAFTAPGATRDRTAAVEVSPALEREWLLQLSPGSGVYPGYKRPDLAGRVSDPKTRTYPGYAAPVPGAMPGYANGGRAIVRPNGAAKNTYAYSAAGAARSAEPQRTAGGLFGALRKTPPAAKTRAQGFDPMFLPQMVDYRTAEKPGTLIIDTNARFLYLVEEGGKARRYGVGVGKPGFEWAGRHQVSRKSEWPTWTPPEQMRQREAAKGRILPVSMQGGPENPLGARAMYLGSTLYRIHGTNQPWSIGKAVSSGCIRMRNEDVTDLYGRVPVGTSVIVL